MPGGNRALASYSLPADAPVCDLNEPGHLIEMGLRPADVVARDYQKSRDWARRIWEQHRWIGVRWWSYYDSRWASTGLWDSTQLKLQSVKELTIDDPELLEAGRIIVRRVVSGERSAYRGRR